MARISFHQVKSSQDLEQAGLLIREYLAWLNERVKKDYSLEFDIEAMVKSDLTDPHKFQPPSGRFYLVRYDGEVAGVGCLKNLGEDIAEIQRMYVPPHFRGKGLGRAIVNRLVEDARQIGYHRLKLESLEFLEAAHQLYRSVGFQNIDPYTENSMKAYQAEATLDQYYAITVFMEMEL